MRETTCPQCSSTNVIFSKKHQTEICEDCAFKFSQPFSKLNIFLSYGHDSNAPLVEMIMADLKERGHHVWFDKNDIKAGDEWRREITDGIIGSNRVVSFLSRYSTRDPGVCLDELGIS